MIAHTDALAVTLGFRAALGVWAVAIAIPNVRLASMPAMQGMHFRAQLRQLTAQSGQDTQHLCIVIVSFVFILIAILVLLIIAILVVSIIVIIPIILVVAIFILVVVIVRSSFPAFIPVAPLCIVAVAAMPSLALVMVIAADNSLLAIVICISGAG